MNAGLGLEAREPKDMVILRGEKTVKIDQLPHIVRFGLSVLALLQMAGKLIICAAIPAV